MMAEILVYLLAFLLSYYLTPVFIKYFKEIGVVAIDMHKKGKPKIAGGGGVPVALSIIFSMLVYIGLKTFLEKPDSRVITEYMAMVSSILMIMFIGFLDDIRILKKKTRTKIGEKDIRVGLPQWLKPLATIPAAIPLMVIKAGSSTMTLPIIGTVNFGLVYPLILVPIGVVGASNMVNLLGGFNGSEAGMGIVYMLTLGIIALHNNIGIYPLFFVSCLSLLGFIIHNWYPARILPGDSLTYLLGSIVASGVIVGNMEKAGVMVLSLFFLEFILKLRSKLKATSLGKLRRDGTIAPPYGKKIYSVTHIVMNLGKFTEKQISIMLVIIQMIISTIVLLSYLL